MGILIRRTYLGILFGIDRKQIMLSYENVLDILINKKDGKQEPIEKLNSHYYKNFLGVYQNPLEYMNNRTTDLQKKIQ